MTSASRATHTPSVWQLVLGIVSLSLALLTVLALAGINLAGRASGNALGVNLQPLQYLIWVVLAVACSAIPSIVTAARRINHRDDTPRQTSSTLLISSIALLLLIPLAWLTKLPLMSSPTAFLRAAFNILFVGIPAWWIVELGRRGLPRITRQKQWGLLNFGVFVTMPLVVIVEVLLLAFGAALLIGWLSNQPDFAPVLEQVKNLLILYPQRLDLLTDQLEPLLKSPVVLGVILLSFSLVIPLVEELLKPLALWFFIRRAWSPAEGFIAGMLSGAAFSFIESIAALATDFSADWLTVVAVRAAAALLHIAAAGLMGWALTSCWKDGKFFRLGLIYIGVTLIHGAWNFFAVSFGLSPFLTLEGFTSMQSLVNLAPWVMGLLVAALIVALIKVNSHLKKTNRLSSLPPQLPPALPE